MDTLKPIRILIADDHPMTREGIISVINARTDMKIVAETANGLQAVEAFFRERPDVVLMDLRMPEMNGLEATRKIMEQFPRARILVLTAYDGDEYIHQALKSGALGYLLKDTSKAEVISAIQIVHSGSRYVPPDVFHRMSERISVMDLSAREMQVLKLIVKGKSNKEIADELKILEGTVKYHVSMILSKMNVQDRTEAATAALRRGLVNFD
ncbi:MAG: DNA-binding response regulator [Acidobacteria bacterium]|nr:MAG: DNA-binding response regulator [Acidobacteriota bacterium]